MVLSEPARSSVINEDNKGWFLNAFFQDIRARKHTLPLMPTTLIPSISLWKLFIWGISSTSLLQKSNPALCKCRTKRYLPPFSLAIRLKNQPFNDASTSQRTWITKTRLSVARSIFCYFVIAVGPCSLLLTTTTWCAAHSPAWPHVELSGLCQKTKPEHPF